MHTPALCSGHAIEAAAGFRDLLHTLEGDGFAAPDALQNAVEDKRKNFDPAARHKRQFDQLVAFTQKQRPATA